MSTDLDRELAEAVGPDDSADDDGMSVPRPEDGADKGPKKGNIGLLATLLVMTGAIVALFMVGFQEAAVYSMPVDQFVAQKAQHAGRRIRIEGELVPGTLVKRDKPCEFRFQVTGETRQVDVRYAQCIVPDTFRDVPEGGVQVTAEGTLTDEGHFEATMIMAKCSSKYDPETHTMDEAAAKAAASGVIGEPTKL
jgi:cytochrome c-type biogenesis protein CcmE